MTATETLINLLTGAQIRLGPSDVPAVIQTAKRHRVIPQLYTHASQHDGLALLAQNLSTDLRRVAAKNLQLGLVLGDIVRAMTERGIPQVSLKGPVLARLAYGSLAGRCFDDLDILVHPGDRARTCTLLAEMGYHNPYALRSPFASALREWRVCESTLLNPTTNVYVEPHWSLIPSRFRHRMSVSDLLARSVPVTVGDAVVPSLCVEDMVLHLILHAAEHGWWPLRWYLDLRALLRSYPDLAWGTVTERAAACGAAEIVAATLNLLHAVLDVEYPPSVKDWLLTHTRPRFPANQIIHHLLSDASPEMPGHRRALHSLPRGRTWLQYQVEEAIAVLSPHAADLDALSLPRPLHAAYLPLRPVRLLLKHSRRLTHGRRDNEPRR